jgi:TolA-binding protein
MNAYTTMLQKPTPGIDMKEVGKEIFGHLGYADGQRFFSSQDPQVLQLQQQLQQAQGVIQQLQQKVTEKNTAHQVALQKTQITNQTQLQKQQMSDAADLKRTLIQEDNKNKRDLATHWRALHEKDLDINNAHQQRMQAAAQPQPLPGALK